MKIWPLFFQICGIQNAKLAYMIKLHSLKYPSLLNNVLLVDSRKRGVIVFSRVENYDPAHSLILKSVNHKKTHECNKGPSKEDGRCTEIR